MVGGEVEVHGARLYRMTIRNSSDRSNFPCRLQGVANPPTRPALRERYDRRQQRVVDEAARVFAERGYDRTTMQELGDALGIAAGGLYHYIGSKEQLLIRICDQLMEPLLEQARALVAAGGAPADAAARPRRAVGRPRGRAPRPHARLPAGAPPDRVGRAVARRARAAARRSSGSSRRCSRARARPPATPRIALAALLGMVNHTAQWYRPSGRLGARARSPTATSR